jgi:hypothetical protein
VGEGFAQRAGEGRGDPAVGGEFRFCLDLGLDLGQGLRVRCVRCIRWGRGPGGGLRSGLAFGRGCLWALGLAPVRSFGGSDGVAGVLVGVGRQVQDGTEEGVLAEQQRLEHQGAYVVEGAGVAVGLQRGRDGGDPVERP